REVEDDRAAAAAARRAECAWTGPGPSPGRRSDSIRARRGLQEDPSVDAKRADVGAEDLQGGGLHARGPRGARALWEAARGGGVGTGRLGVEAPGRMGERRVI